MKASTGHRIADLSRSSEDYLREMWLIEECGERITTHALARRLQVSAPSVTQKLHHLATCGLVTCVPYGPICLTESGRRAAHDVMKRYDLARAYLTTILGYSTDTVDADADRLEHALSPTLQSRMATRINECSKDL